MTTYKKTSFNFPDWLLERMQQHLAQERERTGAFTAQGTFVVQAITEKLNREGAEPAKPAKPAKPARKRSALRDAA